MAIRIEDCSPALRARIEAALANEPPGPLFAMATFLGNKWTVGPATDNWVLIDKQVRKFNTSSPQNAHHLLRGKPRAVRVTIR